MGLRKLTWQPEMSVGFNAHYVISYSTATDVAYELCDKTFWNNIDYLFINPSDFVVSLKLYPFKIEKYFRGSTSYNYSQSELNIGRTYMSGIYGNKFKPHTYYYELASFNVARKYNNFMDFEPFTKLELYVPYFPILNLDTNAVMGKTIKIGLSVDFDTGIAMMYVVKCESGQTIEKGDILMIQSSQVGFEIPIGASNNNENQKTMLANGLSTIAGAITSVAMGNSTPLLVTGINAINKTINSMQLRYSKGGASSGKSSFCASGKVCLMRTTSIPTKNQMDYAHTKGLPLNEKRYLSNMRGFTQIQDIHVSGINNATKSEIDEIESLLISGVIL